MGNAPRGSKRSKKREPSSIESAAGAGWELQTRKSPNDLVVWAIWMAELKAAINGFYFPQEFRHIGAEGLASLQSVSAGRWLSPSAFMDNHQHLNNDARQGPAQHPIDLIQTKKLPV